MKHFLIVLSFFLSYLSGITQGSGSALDFAGTSANEHVNFGNAIMNELNTSSFSIELWVKPESINGDPSILANKDWDSGNNTGFVLALENGNEFTFNFRAAGGTRRDLNFSVDQNLLNYWHHIAVTVDRQGVIRFYHNGVEAAPSASIAADSGLPISEGNSLRLGQDGVGNYNLKFDGQTDELRVWNTVRSTTEIRENMCKKLQGDETGLIHYYPLNEGSGSLLEDLAGQEDGTYLNGGLNIWKTSGAPIGDDSQFLYVDNWSSEVIALASISSGTYTIENINSDAEGIQVYRVDEAPNSDVGLIGMNGNQTYFGYFTCNGGSFNGDVIYDYSEFTSPSITDPNALLLLERDANDQEVWTLLDAANMPGAQTIEINGMALQAEHILANLLPITCSEPSNGMAENVGYTEASLNWQSGGSVYWNIEFGPQGFIQGSGVVIELVNMQPYLLTDLLPSTSYEFYIQDVCPGVGESDWIGPFQFSTLTSPGSIGGGTSLRFDGVNDYINCGNNPSLRPTQEITYEAWINPELFVEEWTGIFTHLQDNATNESGYGLVYYQGEVRAYMQTTAMGGDAWNDAPGVEVPYNQWSHLACTYDGQYIRIYLNGIAKDSLATSGNIDWQFLPQDFRIGVFHDNNEDWYYQGQVDEIRIWNVAKSQEEIRTNMCRKLSGNESNLIAYFNLNEALGNEVVDGSTNDNNGTMINMPADAWRLSGAAIGDTSVFVYPETWEGVITSLSSELQGTLEVSAMADAAEGVQIYYVESLPFYVDGIQQLPNSSSYFGTFVIAEGQVSHDVSFKYDNYSDALADETNLVLFNRNNGSESQWVNLGATLNNDEDLLEKNLSSRRECFLGTSTGTICAAPLDIIFNSIDESSVEFTWNPNSASAWNYEYGNAGFSLGSGNLINGSTSATIDIEGLTPNTYYDFYVQSDCSDDGESFWIGPISFYSQICSVPSSLNAENISANSVLLSWEGVASLWRIQWGPVGFNLGTGIQVANVNTNSYTLNNLAFEANYEYYVRSECTFGNSQYSGPFPFSTLVNGLGENVNANSFISFWPNPANEVLTIKYDTTERGTLKIINSTGIICEEMELKNGLNRIDLNSLSSGLYFLNIQSNGLVSAYKFIKK